jgi:long-chain acyl-CoA synthetase
MLYRVLQRQAKKFDHKIAVSCEQRSLSYSELLRETDKHAAHLQSLQLGAGARLILGIPPSPDFHAFFFAAAAVGAIIIPVLPSGKLSPAVRESGAVLAVGDKSFLSAVRKTCRGLEQMIVWDRSRGIAAPEGLAPFKWKRQHNRYVFAVSSSGTTGAPALYYRTAQAALERAKLRSKLFGLTPEDVLFSTRPYNNGSSINNHVIMPVVAGCRVVVREKIQRFAASAAVAQEKVTVLYAVPFIFELLASISESRAADFSSLRLCISGGAPLSRAVYDRFYQLYGIRIRQLYGGSHFHPACAYNLSDLPDAVGQLTGVFPMAILSDNGTELGPGMNGEIVFDVSKAAPAWKRHLESNPNRRGRYLYTGDLGRTDADGNVFIVGRKSQFIKVGANRVAPAEVESVLRSHPGITEAVVYALRPGQRDEAVGATVVSSGGVSSQELMRHCARHLDGYKCPRKINFRTRMPRNAHGKVMLSRFKV